MPAADRPESRPRPPGPRVVLAPDKLRGTLRAVPAAAALAEAAGRAGWSADACPMSDGGEGFLEVLGGLGGAERRTWVTGPLGDRVEAAWRLAGDLAVIESALASGLELAGGAEGNRPLEATSRGTGELLAAAIGAGARRVLVGVGGSAMTDGGEGAVEAVEEAGGLGGARVVVACDVETRFVDAAEQFGPQKGADPRQVASLRRRLAQVAAAYARRYGVDVTTLSGAGAAGGLAGGLAALGARLAPGFEVVAGVVGLERRMARASLAVTAEGRLDASSWRGKVVGGVADTAARHGLAVVVLAGSVEDAGAAEARRRGVEVVDLEARFGTGPARADAPGCLARAAVDLLRGRPWPRS
jgi:glycerate kinase